MLRSLALMLIVLAGLLVPPLPATAAAPAGASEPDPVELAAARPDFFGIVGRDPLYTLDAGERVVAPHAPADFLDRLAAEIAQLGARWVRIEFHAEETGPAGPGVIDYEKYDYFIRVIAPRHGLKVLVLLNSGIVTDTDPYYWLPRLEDPPDGAGADPTDLSNNYIRVFADRAREIADRYGDAVAAYEVFNEPNVNAHKLILFQGRAQEIDPERIGALLTQTYLAIKPRHPRIPVIMGGLLHGAPVEKPYRIPSDYLAEVYLSPRVQWFFQTRPLGPEQLFPWDAVALHPYDLSPENVETHVREIKARMATVGDPYNKIWITEIGMQAEPPPIRGHWLMEPTPQEVQQADYLTQVYTRLLALPELVERVFWFKYEDFRERGLPRNWGLVRLRENGQGQYDPAAIPFPRKPAYAAYQRLANPAALPTAPRPARPNAPDQRYFPETGQEISGVFLHFWDQHGGLARFGLPRTAAFWQGGRLVQYFERARFERFPEYGGTPNEVQLGLLGQQIVESGRLRARAIAPPPTGANTRYFPETRYAIANGFKAYWEQNGGLRSFGLPITPELREINPADGREYTVQYFERARFEWHPEHAGTPHEIQLGLLGNQFLAGGAWYR
jgi:hypothetical protein